MKATGIVRRIDDLGRIVIPKEIRRVLEVNEGDPLEIFIDEENGIVLRKYGEENYADRVGKLFGYLMDDYELTEDEKLICNQVSAMVARIEGQG